jgi:hypothetical protein
MLIIKNGPQNKYLFLESRFAMSSFYRKNHRKLLRFTDLWFVYAKHSLISDIRS